MAAKLAQSTRERSRRRAASRPATAWACSAASTQSTFTQGKTWEDQGVRPRRAQVAFAAEALSSTST